MPSKFYVTTPIYYVNARPHIGHAYTTIVADVLARRHRLLGDEVYFLTGTDEHGQKIERSAAAAGIPPQQFADEVSKSFSDLWTRMGITHSQFIRTTSEAHKQGVQQLFRTLYERGQIYLSSYTGQYSIGEEMFVEGPPGTIGPDGRPTETVTEENFFFRLSDYQLPLLNLIESDTLKITPESRKNEVLSFLRGVIPSEASPSDAQPRDPRVSPGSAEMRTAAGIPYTPGALRDLSISRSSFTWGIPVPEDIQHAAGATQPHIVYVWLDALANYITALGYGSADTTLFDKFWLTTQDSPLQLVGKEIIRFHCVYWPAFLLAAGLPLPRAVSAHGWLLFDDSKMSKSKGNIVRTETILAAFGTLCPPLPPHPEVIPSEAQSAQSRNPRISPALTQPSTTTENSLSSRSAAEESAFASPTPHDRDLFAADVLRYFLLREIPFGQDGSFTFEALITRYNADLANGYGNLVSRVLNLLAKHCAGVVPHRSPRTIETITDSLSTLLTILPVIFSNLELSRGLEKVWTYIGILDAYLSSQTPWKSGSLFQRLFLHLTPEQQQNPAVQAALPWNGGSYAELEIALERVSADIQVATVAEQLAAVLYTAAESIRIITALLHPILPYATASVWRQLGLGDIELAAKNGELNNLQWGGLQPGTKLGPLSPIFPRADKSLIQKMIAMENPDLTSITANNDATHPDTSDFPETPIADEAAPGKKPLSRLVDETSGHTTITNPAGFDPAAGPRTSTFAETAPGNQVGASAAPTPERPATPPHTEAPASGIFAAQPQAPQITIDDFAKIELRVAQIVVAERIPKADKLLRLEVDLGTEKRQILSGIAEWYTPEELLGRRIVVITNLAPRKMRGLESHGMLLAASTEGGKPHLATFAEADSLPLGSRLK